ncbi:MAG: I78 family peptidase inhibitor [Rhodobacteraceae bacterium]|nr:I78 family peptidase inhibitor [Paracoccaceae bacterium]
MIGGIAPVYVIAPTRTDTTAMKPQFLALFLLVAACVSPETPVDTSGQQPGDLIGGGGSGGLVEREPDLCQASMYQQYIGQPGTIVPMLPISRIVRVIEFGEIFTQEYNPSRINFWLAPTGEITRISCG